jgi:hypothetical protein
MGRCEAAICRKIASRTRVSDSPGLLSRGNERYCAPVPGTLGSPQFGPSVYQGSHWEMANDYSHKDDLAA